MTDQTDIGHEVRGPETRNLLAGFSTLLQRLHGSPNEEALMRVASEGLAVLLAGSPEAAASPQASEMRMLVATHVEMRRQFLRAGVPSIARPLVGQVDAEDQTAAFAREYRLTRREHEILSRILQGKRDAEIGAELGISGRTVGKHVEHLFCKLRVKSRTTAAAMVREYRR